MSIDKAMYQAPQGLPELQTMEIEIEDPESVKIHAGDIDIEIEKEEKDFDENLAEDMSEGQLMMLSGELLGEFQSDVDSRRDWIQTYVDGLELLGLKIEERSQPWEGACGVYHPVLAEAVIKFQSETIMETFPAAGPVRGEIVGKETPEKKDAMSRVVDDMNHELVDVMTEFRPEHERMLWGVGLSGNGFKKVYVDPGLDRQISMYVPADDLVVPYGASSLEQADRITHVMRKTENELIRLQVDGFYRNVDLGTPNNTFDEIERKIAEKLGFRATTDDRYKILEMHVNLDLEGYEHTDKTGEPTGLALPYVVTIEKSSATILSIRRNWDPDDKTNQKRQHFVHYGYIPGFGFYNFGLIHLIGAFAKSGTSILRQLVDAGSLSNLPGGFKTRGLRVKGDDTPIAPGEFRDVDVPSGSMKDNIMALPYKEPSQTLMTLLNQIVEEGRRFASSGDLKASAKPEVIIPELAHNTGGHSTRDIAFTLDNKRLIISVGSVSNVAEAMSKKTSESLKAWNLSHAPGAAWDDEENRADILHTDPEGKLPLKYYATGVRNAVGIAIQPDTGKLWVSTNERDALGDDLVPDYITHIEEGGFYGWPWYYMGNHEDPRHAGERPDLAGKAIVPDLPVQPHSATLQLTFYPKQQAGVSAFPSDYTGDIFAAFHGSWNRTGRTGSKVIRVHLVDGKVTGSYEDFITGFVVDDGHVWGRPVGVTVAYDGALIVSDDANGTLWRVSTHSK